jgi:hypothetical protein
MYLLKKLALGLLVSVSCIATAHAQDFMSSKDLFGSGKLLATGGVTELEGAGGGGITPWALITGYGTDRQIGASAFGTYAGTSELAVTDGGVAVGLFNRVELSFAHLNLNTGSALSQPVLNAVNHGSNNISENIEGLKVRLFGDAVYDKYVPEVSGGVLFQQSDNKTLVTAIGAKTDGETYYLAATKVLFNVLFGRDVLLDADIIGTNANQLGLLGFGSGNGSANPNNSLHAEFAGSAAVLITRSLVLGGDFRTMPMNMKSVGKASNWGDVFLAYFPMKGVSIVGAYAMLGSVAPAVDAIPGRTRNENAFYVSAQLSF